MYRICIALSGYYYVQKYNGCSWRKFGGFFPTRAGARRFVRVAKRADSIINPDYSKVVEYL